MVKANSVSLPGIEHEVLGTTREDNIRAAEEMMASWKDPIATADAEFNNERTDEWYTRVHELMDDGRKIIAQVEKLKNDDGKPAGADQGIARRFVQDSLRAQFDVAEQNDGVNSDRMIAAMRHMNGAKVRWDDDFGNLVFEFPKAATRKAGGTRTVDTSKGRLGSVIIYNEHNQPIEHYSGGPAGLEKWMTEKGAEAGFNTDIGAGTDPGGSPYIWSKGQLMDNPPKEGSAVQHRTLPTEDGRHQVYMLRYGDTGSYNTDYKVASATLSPGHRVEFTNKEGTVVGYHRKDADGVTHCSPTGKSEDEKTKKFELHGVTFNG